MAKSIYKQYRRLRKKNRRKKIRQKLAKERDELEPNNSSSEDDQPEGHNEIKELERVRRHQLWLEREKEALRQIQLRQEREERVQVQREEEKRRIQADFEKLEMSSTLKKKKEEALKEVISKLPDGSEPWHNPIVPPATPNPSSTGAGSTAVGSTTEKCHFFEKTGACRFGDRCSRGHDRPNSSRTILIRGMFVNMGIEQMLRDEYDTDIGLEFEEGELYQHFVDFYEDVLPEFKRSGRVVQFKVCCNYEAHLRGNVYVQFETEEEAGKAFTTFNGRWYGGKILSCEFSSVTRWKSAICGTFLWNRCPKGRGCNFLHVFRNPRGEFRDADQDLFHKYRNGRSNVLRERSRSPNDSSWNSVRSRDSSRRSSWHESRRKTDSSSRSRTRRSRSRSPSGRRRRVKTRASPKAPKKSHKRRKRSKKYRGRSDSNTSSGSSDGLGTEHREIERISNAEED